MKIHNLSNYFSAGLEKGKYSEAILKFRNGSSVYVREIVKCSKIFARQKMDDYDYIIRALGANEEFSLGNKPLDFLCFHMADVLNAKYLKNYFAKSQHKNSFKSIKNKGEYRKYLSNIYYIKDNHEVDLNMKRILLIDDTFINGATIEVMEEKIKKRFPDCIIEAFILEKSVKEALQVDSINNHLQINIEDDYYDNADCGPKWKKNGYLKIGFLKSKHIVFPQEWDCEVIVHSKNGNKEYYVMILLEESKELFLTTLGRLKALFWETDLFVRMDDLFGIDTGKYYIGVNKRDPYLIRKGYTELFSEMIPRKLSSL